MLCYKCWVWQSVVSVFPAVFVPHSAALNLPYTGDSPFFFLFVSFSFEMCLCVQFKPSDDDNDDYGHWTVNKGYDLISLNLQLKIYLWSCKWYLKVFCTLGSWLVCVYFCKHIVSRIRRFRRNLIYIPMSSAQCKSVQCIVKRAKSNYYLFCWKNGCLLMRVICTDCSTFCFALLRFVMFFFSFWLVFLERRENKSGENLLNTRSKNW